MTPYEKLKSLDGAERHLVPGVSFEALDVVAASAACSKVGSIGASRWNHADEHA